jgi:hypothetical protein
MRKESEKIIEIKEGKINKFKEKVQELEDRMK